MKIAIISFAHIHANNYAYCLQQLKDKDVEFVAIADEDRRRGEGKAAKLSVKYYFDYEELLQKEDLDAVIICAPNSKHKEITMAAAQSKKDILCEKPIATTISDAKEMIKICTENRVIYQQIFPMRYSPAVQEVKTKIDEGKIGEILAICSTNRGKMPDPNLYPFFTDKELAGGGAVIDHTVHVIDLIRWFTGKEVTEVYAEIGRLLHSDIEVEDCGILSFKLENDIIATLDTSWSRPECYPTWGDVTMDIIGKEGVIFLDAFAQVLNVYNDPTGRISWNYWGSNMDMLMIEDFINTIKEKKRPKVTGYDGLKALEVAIAAYRSASEKKAVELPF